MKAKEIRQRFLEYFQRQGHTIVPSSSLIPKDDPTLLFTNAGMVQFKKIFLGQEKREYTRATTAQKCLRVGGKHNDLENVGRTARHHTFFEMLGNFSFGDYFKAEAIQFAWEFLTKELGLDPKRLYITVYKDDDEAASLWQKIANVPQEKIFRLGEKDNFWAMGDTGPCGPCSEILFDQGEEIACGPNCGIGVCDCDRYLEIWNLVFMQYNRDEDGNLTPLPKPSIDTGMGLERIAAVCQGVYSNFDSDLFKGIIEYLCDLAKVNYRENEDIDTALRVIADHLRAISFMIADGILPANEGRGYVLRRLIRRAYRFGRLLNFKEPFLFECLSKVTEEMQEAYPELLKSEPFAKDVVLKEEERFSLTLDKGLKILAEEIEGLKKAKKQIFSGDMAFKLYDTYGFPLDIIRDITEKEGLALDEAGFEKYMQEQKARAKEAWKGSGERDLTGKFAPLVREGVKSEFIGYEFLSGKAFITHLVEEKGELVSSLKAGERGYIVTDKTPFYGESGGQVGDRGRIIGSQAKAQVVNTLKVGKSLIVHEVEIKEGTFNLKEEVSLLVDEGERIATARNHTATHLLHAALRKVLGEHVKQAGSLVEPKRLRFDFTHIKPLSQEELKQIEAEVNRVILAGVEVETETMEYEEAVQKGAMALFGEKYEEKVRVVRVPGFSMELCGGTHLKNTSQAGLFVIVKEEGVAAGVRRIEALTGLAAYNYIQELRDTLREVQNTLEIGSSKQVIEKVKGLVQENKLLTKENKRLTEKIATKQGKDLLNNLEEISGVKVLTAKLEVEDIEAMRKVMDDLKSKLASGVILLGSNNQGKALLLLSVSKDLHKKFTAPALIKSVAKEVGGGGGGRPDLAQAGGSKGEHLEQAFKRLKELIAQA